MPRAGPSLSGAAYGRAALVPPRFAPYLKIRVRGDRSDNKENATVTLFPLRIAALSLCLWALVSAPQTATAAETAPADKPAAETMDTPKAEDTEKTTSAEELDKKVKEALEALKTYSAEKKDEAAEHMQSLMQDMDGRIARLQADLDEKRKALSESARRTTEETLEALKQQRDELSGHYDKLKQGSAKAWEDIKQGFSEAMESFRKSLQSAEEEVQKEI